MKMKKYLIALFVLVISFAQVSFAAEKAKAGDSPMLTVKPILKISLSMDTITDKKTLNGKDTVFKDDNTNASGQKLASHSPKVGIKGDYKINDQTKAIFQLKYNANFTTSKPHKSALSLDTSYVGVSNKTMGTITLGKLQNFADFVHSSINFQRHSIGDFRSLWYMANNATKERSKTDSAYKAAYGGDILYYKRRIENAIRYDYAAAGIKANIMLAPNNPGSAVDAKGKAASTSVSDNMVLGLAYGKKSKGFYAGLGYSVNSDSSGYYAATSGSTPVAALRKRTGYTVAVQYAGTVSADQKYKVGLSYINQSTDAKDAMKKDIKDGHTTTSLAFKYTVGKFSPKFIYNMISYENTKRSASAFALGVDYNLAKKAKSYIHYGSASFKDDSNADKKYEETKSELALGVIVSL